MKTVTLETPGVWSLKDTPHPGSPPVGQALVRVHRVGLCGTDIHAYKGRQPFFTYPRILGHELGVEVIEVGENARGLKAGDRCAVEPYLNCGRCPACRAGKGNCCTHLKVLGVHIDGGHREYLHVPVEKLHVSATLSYDQLALVEPLGIGAHAVERGQVSGDDTVLVIGAGPIGLSLLPFIRARGAKTIVLDVNEERLAFCREKMGVTHTLVSTGGEVTEKIAALNNGDLPNVVIDATGNPQSMAAAFHYPAHGGRLVFVGLFQGDLTFNDPNFHRRELTVFASRNALPGDFRSILKLVEDGSIDTSPWITHRTRLEELQTVFEKWIQPGSGLLKGMIEV